MEKLDLVIWTLNSEKTLPFTLASMKGDSRKNVNNKLVIDGKSENYPLAILGYPFGASGE
jgi:hypothetical protein